MQWRVYQRTYVHRYHHVSTPAMFTPLLATINPPSYTKEACSETANNRNRTILVPHIYTQYVGEPSGGRGHQGSVAGARPQSLSDVPVPRRQRYRVRGRRRPSSGGLSRRHDELPHPHAHRPPLQPHRGAGGSGERKPRCKCDVGEGQGGGGKWGPHGWGGGVWGGGGGGGFSFKRSKR